MGSGVQRSLTGEAGCSVSVCVSIGAHAQPRCFLNVWTCTRGNFISVSLLGLASPNMTDQCSDIGKKYCLGLHEIQESSADIVIKTYDKPKLLHSKIQSTF